MTERPLNKHCLDSSDVFILDLGLQIYQWNGSSGNKDERFRAAEYLQGIKVSRLVLSPPVSVGYIYIYILFSA